MQEENQDIALISSLLFLSISQSEPIFESKRVYKFTIFYYMTFQNNNNKPTTNQKQTNKINQKTPPKETHKTKLTTFGL